MYRLTTPTLYRAATLAVVLLAVACNKKKDEPYTDPGASTSSTTPAAIPAFHVTDVTVGKGLNPDKTLKDETGDFGVRDTIYVGVKTEGAANGAKVLAKWSYQTGQPVSESSQTITTDGAVTRHEFHIQKASAWPKGNYKVEIMLDGVPAGSKDFTIK